MNSSSDFSIPLLPSAEKSPEPDIRPNTLPTGTSLQQYVIGPVLGESGSVIVYRAHDPIHDQDVIIEEYLPFEHAGRTSDAMTVVARTPDQARFYEEGLRCFEVGARLLMELTHPALARPLDVFSVNGTAYRVMPCHQGESLRKKVDSAAYIQSTTELLSVLLPLLGALDEVHRAGRVHLDISLDNILIQHDGAPVLLGFGASHRAPVSREDPVTVILEPEFAAIEQYTQVGMGAWTDLYALSAATYAWVSGRAPAPSVARLVRDPVHLLAQSCASPELPAAVLRVIDTAMAIRPEERFKTADAFAQALKAAAQEPTPVITVEVCRAEDVSAAPASQDDESVLVAEVPSVAQAGRQALLRVAPSVLLSGMIATLVIMAAVLTPDHARSNIPTSQETTKETAATARTPDNPPLAAPVTTAPVAEETLPTTKNNTGTLSVSVWPHGRIYLNGKFMGEAAPDLELSAPEGTNKLYLKKGKDDFFTLVTIKKEERTHLSHRFRAEQPESPPPPAVSTPH